jgi:hypothetical protein
VDARHAFRQELSFGSPRLGSALELRVRHIERAREYAGAALVHEKRDVFDVIVLAARDQGMSMATRGEKDVCSGRRCVRTSEASATGSSILIFAEARRPHRRRGI